MIDSVGNGDRHVPAITSEPVRDWSFGVVTGHRLQVVLSMIIGIAVLYGIQDFIWHAYSQPHTSAERIWAWGQVLWIIAFIPGTLGLLGMLKFRHPANLDNAQPIHTLVSWRIVSRGINLETLISTIQRCQREMGRTPLFPYVIEVIIDNDVSEKLPADRDIRYIRVPDAYRTCKKTRYKARALHYAAEHSDLPDDSWIIHLDEETQPTSSGIKGICAFIREEEYSENPRIGQGAILYHRQWRKFPFLTLADNVRTGGDFAQFHLEHTLGITFFGFHGSYIVVRNDIEKSIGFDFGPQGSITEDAFWALVAMEKGHRSRWVEGYLEEQSTQSVSDFIRQRRRWFQGLAKVALYAPVKAYWRFSIGLFTVMWILEPITQLYTIIHFFYGFTSVWWIRFLANYSFVSFLLIYLVGLKANLEEHGVRNLIHRTGWYMYQIFLYPVFSFLESMGVVAAIVRPAPGFHVVKK